MKLTKESRQRATAQMLKCACGNVAGLGQTQCGACQTADDDAVELENQLDSCVDVADLKEFIRIYLIKE